MNDPIFTCPDCHVTEKELDRSGHKPGCPNPKKAEKLINQLFGNLLPIKQRSQDET